MGRLWCCGRHEQTGPRQRAAEGKQLSAGDESSSSSTDEDDRANDAPQSLGSSSAPLGGGGGGGGAAACGALTALVQPCNDLFADVMKGAAAEMEVSKTLPPRHLSALNHFNFLYHRRVVLYHRSGKTQLKKGSPVTTAKAK